MNCFLGFSTTYHSSGGLWCYENILVVSIKYTYKSNELIQLDLLDMFSDKIRFYDYVSIFRQSRPVRFTN
jgi:hypothetical protein